MGRPVEVLAEEFDRDGLARLRALREDRGERGKTVFHDGRLCAVDGGQRRHPNQKRQNAVTHFVKMRTLVKILS